MNKSVGIDIGGTSVKAVVFTPGVEWNAAFAAEHSHDGTATGVSDAIRAALSKLEPMSHTEVPVGVCLPGLFDHARECLVRAVNLPDLVGVPMAEMLRAAGVRTSGRPGIFTDALAAGIDDASDRNLSGRLLAISLGTGVGAIVLDGLSPLKVSPPDAPLSSGHIGQFDVSSGEPDAPIGPDGGRGSLEAYIGAPALRSRLCTKPEDDLRAAVRSLSIDDPALRALVRALRVAHAIYRPDHISLLGGIGLGLTHLAQRIHAAVGDRLTNLARPDWTLVHGRHAFHAARGAARLALRIPR